MPGITKKMLDSFKGRYMSERVKDIIDTARIIALTDEGPVCAIHYIFECIEQNKASKAILEDEVNSIISDFDVDTSQFNINIKRKIQKLIRKN